MTPEQDNSNSRASSWFPAALLVFAGIGTVDWVLSVTSSTGVGGAGAFAGWVVFVSLWLLFATTWALATSLVLWGATGRATATPLLRLLLRRLRKWHAERHDIADAPRLATLLCAAAAIAVFIPISIVSTAHLIEERNVAWLIAATALVLQLVAAAVVFAGAAALRRLLKFLLTALRQRRRLMWINTPNVLAAAAVIATVSALYLGMSNRELYFAIEGPTLTLVASAILFHPIAAWMTDERLVLPTNLRRALYATPLLALVLVGVVSQQAEARRLVVLHGEAAKFAFNAMQRHADLDRFFLRGDCPPLGHDGLPADGMSRAEYYDECMDPIYDRPVARRVIPEYDRPDLGEQPSFVFITWDSVRVDRLGFMGHQRDTTPHLDAFAQESLVFERAFAQDSGTGPSFWSLMAGKTPFQVNLVHGNRFPPPIADDEPMLGLLLEKGGYQNEAIMCGSVFDREDWAIRRGFAVFENVCGRHLQRLAPRVTDHSKQALRRLANSDEPFFLWVHYYDPHHPYNSHPDIGYGDSRIDRYDEELTYTDRHLKKLLDAIEETRGDYDRPLFVIIGADHGENFDEHGTDPHARNLYRIVTQVPKIVNGPHIEPRRIEAPVALNDVYPSVLDLAGLDIPDGTSMVSQVPVYFGADPDEDRMIFQENSYSRPRRHTRAVVYRRYHYIMDLTTHTTELYDYVDDPLETNNLVGTGLIEEHIMRQALVRFLESSTIPEGLEN